MFAVALSSTLVAENVRLDFADTGGVVRDCADEEGGGGDCGVSMLKGGAASEATCLQVSSVVGTYIRHIPTHGRIHAMRIEEGPQS